MNLKPTPQRNGMVLIRWRFTHEWRDGSNHDRHWKRYTAAKPQDAAYFMRRKAPGASGIFEFRVEAQ